MRAMVLHATRTPLRLEEVEPRKPGPGEALIRVTACGVCRTDLHLVSGELSDPKLPVIPGHQIVGIVEEAGEGVEGLKTGARVGVPWLAWTCGECRYCRGGMENLCRRARFTGYTVDGGFAERTTADARFCFAIPARYTDVGAAPLLCAGLIGYRAYRMAGDARRIGLYGFGSAAHLLAQLARCDGRDIYAFTRPEDEQARQLARSLGAVWAGSSDERPPEELDAAIIFAPAGPLVPAALGAVADGGTVICAGIHMSDIPSFPYRILWGERVLRSVANLTRADGEDYFEALDRCKVEAETTVYALAEANEALEDLRMGNFQGSAVLGVRSDQ